MSKRAPGELTIKEQKFLKTYIKTGSKKKAALKAYNTRSNRNASEIAKQVLHRPLVKEHLQAMLDRKGLSLEDLTTKMHKSINFNMEFGKASQAVAADLMKFAYKLQDAVPANKTLNANLNLSKRDAIPEDFGELKHLLQDNLESTQKLLDDLKKDS